MRKSPFDILWSEADVIASSDDSREAMCTIEWWATFACIEEQLFAEWQGWA